MFCFRGLFGHISLSDPLASDVNCRVGMFPEDRSVPWLLWTQDEAQDHQGQFRF